MGKVYFVRHGQTYWNVENKICGATDIELTPFGHEQAVESYFRSMSNSEYAAFGVKNCAILTYEWED